MYEDYIKEFMKFCNVSKLSDLLTIEPQRQVIKYLMSLRERGDHISKKEKEIIRQTG